MQGEVNSSHSIPPLQNPHWGFWPPGRSLDREGSKLSEIPGVNQMVRRLMSAWLDWSGRRALCLTCPGQCWVCLPKAYMRSALSRIQLPSSCLSHYPSLAHPTARLWRGAGLASLSIMEAGWVTSARLDCPLWWVGTLGRWCICTETYKGHTDGLWSCYWWMLNQLTMDTSVYEVDIEKLCMFYYHILYILSTLIVHHDSMSVFSTLCMLLLHHWI